MISLVFETLRIVVIGSRAGRARFPSDSAQSMERGSKRDLEKLSVASRETNKRIKSASAGGGSSAGRTRKNGQASWPFCVRAVLSVWVVTSNVDAAIEFVNIVEPTAEAKAGVVAGPDQGGSGVFDRLHERSPGEAAHDERPAGSHRSLRICEREREDCFSGSEPGIAGKAWLRLIRLCGGSGRTRQKARFQMRALTRSAGHALGKPERSV